MKQDSSKRIGLAILRVIAEHALQAIPVYGPYLSLGYDIVVAVKEEVDKDIEQPEIVEALHSLTYAETVTTVDSVLTSTKGKQLTATLSPSEQDEVRRQLLSIPLEIEQLLVKLEDAEKRDELEATRQKRLAAEVAQRQNDKNYIKLYDKLKSQLNRKKYTDAYITIRQMRKLQPPQPELLRLEKWLRERCNFLQSALTAGVQSFLFCGISFAVLMSIFGPSPSDITLTLIFALFYFFAFGISMGLIAGVITFVMLNLV